MYEDKCLPCVLQEKYKPLSVLLFYLACMNIKSLLYKYIFKIISAFRAYEL